MALPLLINYDEGSYVQNKKGQGANPFYFIRELIVLIPFL